MVNCPTHLPSFSNPYILPFCPHFFSFVLFLAYFHASFTLVPLPEVIDLLLPSISVIMGRSKCVSVIQNPNSDSDSDSEAFLRVYHGDEQVVTELREDRQAIKLREEQVQQLSQSITEITTLFKEMADLVSFQGTIVDRIDHNISTALSYTKEANVDLVKDFHEDFCHVWGLFYPFFFEDTSDSLSEHQMLGCFFNYHYLLYFCVVPNY
eukprot:TRINITY_DN10521_c0_g1_i8.p1 TRINITY_DN10521_c0_g1~~TRINITY_DN10521_c0_g1_i8.p1  ORF type:complete len:209 (-),score=35.06 TRINITY_DN10521_c0_g1_i8:171-797(-)